MLGGEDVVGDYGRSLIAGSAHKGSFVSSLVGLVELQQNSTMTGAFSDDALETA